MEKLKRLIEDRMEVSVLEMSKQCGIERHTIAGILNGTTKSKPRLLTVKKICKYFGVDYREYI